MDPRVLEGRPFLDLGTGDGQTLASLVRGPGLVVGVDRSLDALRAAGQTGVRRRIGARADRLPFADAAFATVLAADLFHHLDDEGLGGVLREVGRVLVPTGALVAWWYERPGRKGPDAPRYPRALAEVEAAARRSGFADVSAMELTQTLESPTTVGLTARVRA